MRPQYTRVTWLPTSLDVPAVPTTVPKTEAKTDQCSVTWYKSTTAICRRHTSLTIRRLQALSAKFILIFLATTYLLVLFS